MTDGKNSTVLGTFERRKIIFKTSISNPKRIQDKASRVVHISGCQRRYKQPFVSSGNCPQDVTSGSW